jgi:hypothetical protein
MTKRKRKKFDFVPEVFRDAAERLDGLGYDISYARKYSDRTDGVYLKMHVLDAVSASNTRIRIKIHTGSRKDQGLLEMQGSLIIEGRGNVSLQQIKTVDGLWRFARLDGLCWCGKSPFTEKAAQENLRAALLRRVLLNQSRRREIRYYRCESWGGVYHLTSQKAYAAVPQMIEES